MDLELKTENIQLGNTDIQIPPLGTGCWAWGDRITWNFGHGYQETDCRDAFNVSLENGIIFFDTAEVYGQGRSEKFLGTYLPTTKNPVVVATKFFPYPYRFRRKAMVNALRNSLTRLGLPRVDLYQIHWPFPPLPIEHWVEALAQVYELGWTRAVGVSNYNEEQMRRAYGVLAKHNIPLASNQVDYSLINRKVEINGLLKACQELGVTLIAYSPLAQGVLTGKYTPEKPLPGIRGQRYSVKLLQKLQPLMRLMREIGRNHDGKSPSQVALNWCICKGTLPIPGAKNARQAGENAGGLGWRLTEAEVARLDEASTAVRS